MLALAKRMLRRKDKESIVDAAYNRWGGGGGLPVLPVTVKLPFRHRGMPY